MFFEMPLSHFKSLLCKHSVKRLITMPLPIFTAFTVWKFLKIIYIDSILFVQEVEPRPVHLGSNRMGRQIREATARESMPHMPTSLSQALSRDDSQEFSDLETGEFNVKYTKKRQKTLEFLNIIPLSKGDLIGG